MEVLVSSPQVRFEDQHDQSLFLAAPLAIWELDFSSVKRALDALRLRGCRDLRAHFSGRPEEIAAVFAGASVLAANPMARRAYGFTSLESFNLEIQPFFQPALTEDFVDLLFEIGCMIANGKTALQHAAIIQTPAGVSRHIEAHISVLPGAEQDYSRVMLCEVDLTQRQEAEQARRSSEARLRFLTEHMLDVVGTLDRDLRFAMVSPSVEMMTGYSSEQVQGSSLFAYLSETDAVELRRDLEQIWAERKTQVRGKLRFRHAGGAERWLELSVRMFYDPAGVLTQVVFGARDVTDRQAAEEISQRQIRRLSALREIDRSITGCMDLRVVLGVILQHVRDQLRVDACSVLLTQRATRALRMAAHIGVEEKHRLGGRCAQGCRLAQQALHTRQPVAIPSLAEYAAERELTAALRADGYGAYFAVPLIAKGEVRGVLEVLLRRSFFPDSEWLDFLNTLAGQTAIAIDVADLFDTLQRANLELTHAYEATIDGWSRALDLRDHETEGHTRRVCDMALGLARRLDLPPAQLTAIRHGSLLHDIGKMAIPDSILLKPGPLTGEEWEIMRQHPAFARDLLSEVRFLEGALDIPYGHHEKWDGTGYPMGLAGEAIPLAARIFALADVWDALTNDRPYRKALTDQEAARYMMEQSGRHFDPALVEPFLAMLRSPR